MTTESQETTQPQDAKTATVATTAMFCLFAGHCYYPNGGSKDFRAFGEIDELKSLYAKNAGRWSKESSCYADPWGMIADRATMDTVLKTRGDDGKWIVPDGEEDF